MQKLHQGNLIRITNFETISEDGKTKVRYKAPKGKVFVAVVLGSEDKTVHEEKDLLPVEKCFTQINKAMKSKTTKLEDIPEIESTVTSITGIVR